MRFSNSDAISIQIFVVFIFAHIYLSAKNAKFCTTRKFPAIRYVHKPTTQMRGDFSCGWYLQQNETFIGSGLYVNRGGREEEQDITHTYCKVSVPVKGDQRENHERRYTFSTPALLPATVFAVLSKHQGSVIVSKCLYQHGGILHRVIWGSPLEDMPSELPRYSSVVEHSVYRAGCHGSMSHPGQLLFLGKKCCRECHRFTFIRFYINSH